MVSEEALISPESLFHLNEQGRSAHPSSGLSGAAEELPSICRSSSLFQLSVSLATVQQHRTEEF